MRFVDEAEIYIKAGDGGTGCVSFRRAKYVERGGPDGGDGGKGGDVIVVVDPQMSTLLDYKYQRHFMAKNGEGGFGKMMYGRGSADLTIKVPAGTSVFDADSGDLIADLTVPGDSMVIAHGGRGGRGNMHFATSTRQAPMFSLPPDKGEERNIRLELKLLADVGLVGFPNAGKSTLISRISNARPKIADYPFTTLVPNLGVVRAVGDRDFLVADLPGLIEGAHEGAGLGDRFLRHVERCKMLLYLVEPQGGEGRDAVSDYNATARELKMYSPELAKRPSVVVLSKCETIQADEIKAIQAAFRRKRKKFFVISAVTGKGLKELINHLAGEVEKARAVAAASAATV
jgi:GTP-binding protein